MKWLVQAFTGFSITGWLVLAGAVFVSALGLTVWVQSARIDSLKGTLAGVSAVGDAAVKETARKIRGYRLKMEKADEDLKTTRGALFIANGKLRDYAGRSLLPPAPAGSGKPESICFSRPQLDGALQGFTSGAAELIAECELYRATLENAQRWAGETR